MADYKKLALGAFAGVLAGGAIAFAAEFAGGKPPAKPAGTVQENGKKETAPEIEEEYANADFTVNLDGIKTNTIKAGVSVHDPSVIKIGDEYYIYGSHMTAAKSKDLKTWTSVADGYNAQNPVYGDFLMKEHVFDYTGNMFSAIPSEDGSIRVWAPDIVYNEKQGLYYMYLCTSSTFNASNLCYATSKSPEGPFDWQGKLICSGFNSKTIKDTDVLDYVSEDYAKENYIAENDSYNYMKWPNAIDPTIFHDADGKFWMVYGSFSGGIFLLELDEETGKVIHPEADPDNNVDAYFGKRLLGGGHSSIEAPYILYDENAGYYYLFVSYGGLARTGGYQIRVFRSDKPDGEYVDMNGRKPELGNGNHSYFGLKLSGNYMLPSLGMAYMATGHNSAFIDDDGKKYIVNHTRFDNGTEFHEPRVHQYILNEDGWPCMLPYATDGETVSETGYEKSEVAGEYYVINQGITIDGIAAQPFKMILTEKGNVYGDRITGTWEFKEGSYYVNISYGKTDYKGVLCKMKDEAGTDVMAFSAVGSNESIWGVKY